MKHNNDVSRRTFITTAAGAGVVAGMATVAMPMAAMAEAAPVTGRSRQEDPLEKILSRYGSELGNVNRTAR
jgi:hypothetical protein